MKEYPDCQDLQKHLKEGRRDCWKKDVEEDRGMKEGGQGMEVIEKTRWEGDKTVATEMVRRRMRRGMDEMKRV